MRRKDTIRNGAMLVSPAEVDAVLLLYPDVEQAATFPVPDAKFGESVASVVVPRAGISIDLRRLKWFLSTHLAAHKVPQRIVVAESIPAVASHDMACALGLNAATPSAGIWAMQSGIGEPLFVVGASGDSFIETARPVFGIRAPDLAQLPPPHTVEHVAAECVVAMRRAQPEGPYALGATDASRDVAFEMARQIEQTGERVDFVALFKSDGLQTKLPYDRRHSWTGRTIDVSLARV